MAGSSTWTWYGVSYPISGITTGAWTTFTVTIPSGAGTVQAVGVEFNTNASWTGSVYIDSVSW
jgi:hypothetical protein